MTIKKITGAIVLVAMLAVTSAGAASFSWTKSLKMGSKNAEVKTLQQYLNSCPDTSLGNSGKETTTFGKGTKAAVIKWQKKNGVNPTGTFGPLSQAKAASLLASANPCGTSSTSTTTTTTTTTTPAQTGPVTVSLSQDNPAAGTIVANQATADLMHLTFSGSGTVNSVTLARGGVSDQNTLSNVYLYDGATRLTDGYSFNTNGTITINNLNLAVNGSKTISVKADVATSGYDIFVTLTAFTAGNTANTTSIKGNDMYIASGASMALVNFNAAQSVVTGSVNAGTTMYTVWRQPLQVNTRAVSFKAANFRITGSAPADALSNVNLYVDGVKTGPTATMSMTNGSNYLSFDMTAMPVSLTTGSHTLEVRADVVKGSSYSFTVSVQQSSDLMIADPQVGVNIAVAAYSGVSTNATITIGTGSVTAVVDPSFSSLSNVTGGASNTTIGKFKIHGYGEDVKVTSLPVSVSLTSGATPAGIQNLTLYFNGSQVGSQVSPTAASGVGSLAANCTTVGTNTCYSTTFTLGSQMIIPAGQDSTIEVRADLRNAAGTNYVAGSVNANLGTGTGEGWSSKASISTPSVSGTALTMQTGLLAAAVNTGYASQTQNPNTAGVKIGSFVLQNQSSSEGVRVTSLTVNPQSQAAGAGVGLLTNLSGVKTSETSGSGSVPQQPTSAIVYSVDFTLAPGATKIIDILADTSSATGVSYIPTLTVTGLGASSNTSVSQGPITGQTITLSAGTISTPTLLTSSATSAQYIAAGDPTNTGTGANDATKAAYNFVSTGGSSTITELKFAVSAGAMSVKVGTVSAPVVAGVAWLQGLNIAIANGTSQEVDAFVTYAPVGTSGTASNTSSITSLTYVKYSSGGATATLSPSVAAPTVVLVGSKPTVTVSATRATGLSISAESKIGEITVAADAKGNIKMNKMVFTVSSSGFSTAPTAIASPRLADGSTTIVGTACTPASLVVTCTLDTDANASLTNFDGYTIAAGTSKTFSLYGTLTGAAASGSGTPVISSSVGASTFNWDDSSTNGTNGTNLSGTLIYNFPTSSYSVQQ